MKDVIILILSAIVLFLAACAVIDRMKSPAMESLEYRPALKAKAFWL